MPLSDVPFDTRRDAVVAFIRSHFSEENTGETLQNLHAFEVRMIDLGLKNVVPALRVLLDDDSSHVRVFAAWWMLTLRLGSPRDVRPDQAEKADEVLVNVLKDPDVEKRLWPLILLTATGFESMRSALVPKAAETIILEMLQDSDERIQVPAAAVCVRFSTEEGLGESHQILIRALESPTPGIAMIAAGSFGHLNVRTKNVAQKLATMLDSVEPSQRLSVVMAIKSMAPKAKGLIKPLLKLFGDVTADPGLRGSCAGAMVEFCGKNSVVSASQQKQICTALSDSLESGSWPVLWSAVMGLKKLDKLSPDLAKPLLEFLFKDAEQDRVQSVLVLSEFGPMLSEYAPVLVGRLIVETSQEVCQGLVKAFVAIGTEAVPVLVEEMRAARPNTIVYVAESLVEIGSNAIPEIVEKLLSDADERVREIAVALLHRFGAKAAQAVPTVLELLRHEKPEIREHAAMAMAFIGPAARPAIPALIAALSDPFLDIAHWAQKALSVIGAESVPYIREALVESEGSTRLLLIELLTYFTGSNKGDSPEGFEWVGDDDRLVLFAWVGHTLNRKPDSIRGLARKLEELLTTGVWRHSLPTADATLRENLKALETKLNRVMKPKIKLLESKRGKPTRLTAAGKSLLPKITTYLRTIGRFVDPGRESESA